LVRSISVGPGDNLELIENQDSEIDYVVKVGHFSGTPDIFTLATKNAENQIKLRNQQQQINQKRNLSQSTDTSTMHEAKNSPSKKVVAGYLAVCCYWYRP
jgi:4-diphosphocytidyl-2C-methyl-D-erythritol kinase